MPKTSELGLTCARNMYSNHYEWHEQPKQVSPQLIEPTWIFRLSIRWILLVHVSSRTVCESSSLFSLRTAAVKATDLCGDSTMLRKHRYILCGDSTKVALC